MQADTGVVCDAALFLLGGRHLYLFNTSSQLLRTGTALVFQELEL